MDSLTEGQVWLVFRDTRLLRAVYPLIEAQGPLLLQSVEPEQPLLFQPDPDLPLWLISDFANENWAEALASHAKLQQWLVLGDEPVDEVLATVMDLETLKQWLAGNGNAQADHPADVNVCDISFDHKLAEGEWLLCHRHDTTLLRHEITSQDALHAGSVTIGKPVENWLIPEGQKNLREWFARVDAQRPAHFRAVRWLENENRQWVDALCAVVPGHPELLQCHLVNRSSEARLESGLGLLSRATQLGTLVQMQQLLSELCEWSEADYAAVLVQEKTGLAPELLAEAGPVRPGESQWIHLATLMQKMQAGKLECPERADAQLGDNPFIQTHGLESLLLLEIEQEQNALFAALVLAAREPMPDWKNLRHLTRVLTRILGQELNIRALQKSMRHQQMRDRLTSLPDRNGLIQRLHALAQSGEEASLLLMQLDGMHMLQQSHTHEELDLLFLQLARMLKAMENTQIQAFRPMEDGFALLLAGNWKSPQVDKLVQALLQRLEQGLPVGDHPLQGLSASMGHVVFPEHDDRPRELLRKAQLAVQSAQRQGGGCVVFYNPDIGRSMLEKGRLLKEMPRALQQQQFQVYYQPKVSTETEDITGMEALVRWAHPELGMISPAVFIPLAEESEWIVELGQYILKQSCELARRVNDRFGLALTVGVNVAQIQLLEKNFLPQLREILDQTSLAPEQLNVEVTETQRLLNQAGVQQALKQIREMGCTVAIDDFGTGQSTLEDLRKIPADDVKLDQSFVRNVGIDPHDEAIIQATVDMCHQLNLHTIAEGVETEEQLQFLRKLGCETLQGYLFSQPLSEEDFVALLEAREQFLGRHKPEMAAQDREWMKN